MGRRSTAARAVLAGGLALLGPTAVGAAESVASLPRPQLRALALDEPITVDGQLADRGWRLAEVGAGFVQREPFDGRPATERTEVQVAYTPSTIYIAIRAYDGDPDGIIAREMGRDSSLFWDDSVVVLLDTFLDRRNAYQFETNPNGARGDAMVTDEGRDVNRDWDGIWVAAARHTEEGWQAEIAVPVSTLRFDPELETWGLQVQRRIRRKNEETYWSPLPREAGLHRLSMAGQLEGLRGLEPSRQINLKPFAVGEASQAPDEQRETDSDVGLDVKWGVARNLALDLTYNTDFAEVEVDEQRVNLTRFPLFFPEKREFFLENAGLFEFGPRPAGFSGGPLLKVFHSRRIGLDESGDEVPILAGARLTGRAAGRWNLGTLVVRSETAAAVEETDFAVARVKRNVGQRSSLGAIYTYRNERGQPSNEVLGLDADLHPTRKLNVNGFFARSAEEGRGGDRHASGLGTAYEGRTLSSRLEYLEVGDAFQPEVGFLLRRDIRRLRPSLWYAPRVERRGIRNLGFGGHFEYVGRLSDGVMESRTVEIDYFTIDGMRGDSAGLYVQLTTERLFAPFEIFPGVVIPPGRYDFDPRWDVWLESGGHRKVSVNFWVSDGGFFDGERLLVAPGLKFRPSRTFQLESTLSHNRVELPAGAFTTNVYRQRINLSFSPEHRIDALAQYNDAVELVGINLRYNWIYRPGADLYLVYNQNWDAPSFESRTTRDRQLILKFTYLFQR